MDGSWPNGRNCSFSLPGFITQILLISSTSIGSVKQELCVSHSPTPYTGILAIFMSYIIKNRCIQTAVDRRFSDRRNDTRTVTVGTGIMEEAGLALLSLFTRLWSAIRKPFIPFCLVSGAPQRKSSRFIMIR